MSFRSIRGLISAELLSEKPKCIPNGRPRGAKAAGLRYQRAFGRAIGRSALDGPWFAFRDLNGNGFCQPDFVINLPSIAIVLECKYTWTPEAFAQIELLYLPVLEVALKKPTFGLQVCKRLIPQAHSSSKVVGMLGNGLVLANSGSRVALHWLENTPVSLVPSAEQLKSIQERACGAQNRREHANAA